MRYFSTPNYWAWLYFHESPCNICRFGGYSEWEAGGGDCANCRDFSEWLPFKQYRPEICEKCKLYDDPCHYLCVLCDDANNFEPKTPPPPPPRLPRTRGKSKQLTDFF